MHAFMPARQYRSGHLPRRIMAALLCALLLLTSLSFLAEPAVLASDTRVFSRTLTDADGNRILVQVRCGADTGIPADAVLQVEELTDASASYDAYLEQTEAVLSFGAVGFARFFDITLTSPDDPAVQYQPAEGTVVEVRLQLGDVPLSDPHVIHFAKQAPPEVLENTVDGDLLQFETSGFSVYAIVDAPTSDDLALIARGVEELDGARVMLSIANGSNTYFFKNNLTTHRNFSVIERTNGTAAGAQNAAYYTFEKVAGTSDQFYIYTVDATGAKQYILMTAPSRDNDPVTFSESGGTPFHVELFNNQPGAFYIYKQEGDKKWALNLHSGKAVNGFTGYNDSGANEWVRLAELTDLTQEDFVTYQAHKVSVSDTQQLTDGARVVIYTRIWNDIQKNMIIMPSITTERCIMCMTKTISSPGWAAVSIPWRGISRSTTMRAPIRQTITMNCRTSIPENILRRKFITDRCFPTKRSASI